jgi:hypothetical protein
MAGYFGLFPGTHFAGWIIDMERCFWVAINDIEGAASGGMK